MGLRERSDRLAASGASRAVQDRAPRSEAQRSAVQTARELIHYRHVFITHVRLARRLCNRQSSKQSPTSLILTSCSNRISTCIAAALLVLSGAKRPDDEGRAGRLEITSGATLFREDVQPSSIVPCVLVHLRPFFFFILSFFLASSLPRLRTPSLYVAAMTTATQFLRLSQCIEF